MILLFTQRRKYLYRIVSYLMKYDYANTYYSQKEFLLEFNNSNLQKWSILEITKLSRV